MSELLSSWDRAPDSGERQMASASSAHGTAQLSIWDLMSKHLVFPQPLSSVSGTAVWVVRSYMQPVAGAKQPLEVRAQPALVGVIDGAKL